MKVCVFGAGAVGGHLGARLMAGGTAISVVARGAQLAAIRSAGLRLIFDERTLIGTPLHATDNPTSLPTQDLIFVALKAPALPAAAPAIDRLLSPDGCVVFIVNGIPWWWHHGLTRAAHEPLPLLDPEGVLWDRLRQRTIGCVAYSSNEVLQPGVVQCRGFDRWLFGEPDGRLSSRLRRVIDLLESAGMAPATSTDLRREIWIKLLVNASRNTLGALTRLPSLYLSLDDGLRDLLKVVMQETLDTARASGWDLRESTDLEALASPSGRPPSLRTSMLQDAMAGRPLEHEAVLGQMTAFARAHGVATPMCDVLLRLLRGWIARPDCRRYESRDRWALTKWTAVFG